jgi:hypothetical protein
MTCRDQEDGVEVEIGTGENATVYSSVLLYAVAFMPGAASGATRTAFRRIE